MRTALTLKRIWYIIVIAIILVFIGMVVNQKADTTEVIERRTDTETGYRIDYVNAAGQLELVVDKGYASMICIVDNQSHLETYFDENGTPVALAGGYFGRRIIDVDASAQYIVYLDTMGNPMVVKYGYASIERILKDGKEAQVSYFDLDGNPTTHVDGYYGYKCCYNEKGQIIEVCYLDKEANQTVTRQGYDSIRREYRSDGSLEYEWFYRSGQPWAITGGKYGKRISEEKVEFVDLEGNEIFDVINFLGTNQWLCWLCTCLLLFAAVAAGRRTKLFLLIAYIFFVVYITLLCRDPLESRQYIPAFESYRRFFADYESRREIFNNILLFIPVGVLLRSINSCSKAVLLLLIMPVGIEATQYFLTLGIMSIDDTLSNLSGGVIGYALISNVHIILEKRKINWGKRKNRVIKSDCDNAL